MALSVQVEAARSLTECKAKNMLGDLGTSYRPKTALATVTDFQKSWNALLPSVKTVPGIALPTKNAGMLTVDGLYGEQSSIAADNFLPATAQKLPTAASAMPVWAAQNMSSLDSMCQPAQTSAPLPNPVNLTPTAVSTIVAQATSLPSAVQNTQAPQTTPVPAPPPIAPVAVMTTPGPVQETPQPIQIYSAQSIPVTPTPPPPPAPPPETLVAVTQKIPSVTSLQVPTALPATTITAQKPTGAGAMLIALGVGAVVIGGGVAMLIVRRRHAA